METAYYYLALSGLFTVLMWLPYIAARFFIWGPTVFLHNYPQGYPATEPEVPMWVTRSKRVHLNMIENLPAFIAVVLAAGYLLTGDAAAGSSVGLWAQVFFFARLVHALVYTLGIPGLRVPIYTVSWVAILGIAWEIISVLPRFS